MTLIKLNELAIELLVDIKKDIETFEAPHDEDYPPFLNVGLGIWVKESDGRAWQHICRHEAYFRAIINDMGLVLQNGILDLDETVFELKK
jgi:hypothetical protein